MTQTTLRPDRHYPVVSPVLWRAAGALALAHVVLLFAGFSQERTPSGLDSTQSVQDTYGSGDLSRILTGGYVEALSFVVLLPVLVFLGRNVGRRTELGRWAAQTSTVAGVSYVAVTLAVGLPAGAAALYGAQHGADLGTALMVNNVRLFAFYLSLLVLAGQAIGLGVATLTDERFPRWLGLAGVATGVLLLVGVAGASLGLHNSASMVWTVWFIAFAITLLRIASRAVPDARP